MTAAELQYGARFRSALDAGYAPSFLRARGPVVDVGSIRLRPTADARFLLANRIRPDGTPGGSYVTDGEVCQCPARWHTLCCHREAVQQAGGVAAVQGVFADWRRQFAEGCHE